MPAKAKKRKITPKKKAARKPAAKKTSAKRTGAGNAGRGRSWKRDMYGVEMLNLYVYENKTVSFLAKQFSVRPETIERWLDWFDAKTLKTRYQDSGVSIGVMLKEIIRAVIEKIRANLKAGKIPDSKDADKAIKFWKMYRNMKGELDECEAFLIVLQSFGKFIYDRFKFDPETRAIFVDALRDYSVKLHEEKRAA